MILQRSFARMLQVSVTSENTCNNGTILQIEKNFASFMKESCKDMSDLLNRRFLQESWTNQKSLARLFQDSCISFTFCKILAIFYENHALSCKRLPRILQFLCDRLTRDAEKSIVLLADEVF